MLEDLFYISTQKLKFKNNNIEKVIRPLNSKPEDIVKAGDMFYSLNHYRICGDYLVRISDDKKIIIPTL